MAINRFELVTRHNPILKEIDYHSPLTVGNGELAFTVDVTGLQSLYDSYINKHFPLCTMSQWGWHTKPEQNEKDSKQPVYYTLDDVEMTEFDYSDRKVYYAVDKKAGNEKVYSWLRENPHRLNLARVSFIYKGKEILPTDLTDIHQELNLYEGIIESSFCLDGTKCHVQTACHQEEDIIGIKVESDLISSGDLEVRITFPYGDSGMAGGVWDQEERHTTEAYNREEGICLLKRTMDRDKYYVSINSNADISLEQVANHVIVINGSGQGQMELAIVFSKEEIGKGSAKPNEDKVTREIYGKIQISKVFDSSIAGWKNYWETGGIIDLHKSKDKRALELERRIILSQYLLAIQSCGSMPPQETGLTCNSWHGKFHLEMYLWHVAYLSLWNKGGLLKESLKWYKDHLKEAKENARRNNFKGAKWPKQVAYDGIDSPSPIATLLIWQQPHIIYILEMLYQSEKDDKLLHEYWELIKETADFMCDFAVYNEDTHKYDLVSPIIPAQEEFDPRTTLNPTFEVEYWYFGLKIARQWASRLNIEPDKEWVQVADNMADLPEKDGLYLAHENCPETYEKFNRDHPSMLAAFGLLPSDRVDTKLMKNTLEKVLECWEFDTTWGWDYALIAMTAIRLNMPELAIDILLMDSPKNIYVTSGNNYQGLRKDLPLYLPGNGSLLLVAAMMVAGTSDTNTELPGFPKDGMWEVEYENINPFL